VGQAVLAGNVNLWVALGVAVVWLRPGAATGLAVLGGLIKLYPAVGLLWAIRSRTVNQTAIAAGTGFAILVLAVFGAPLWRDFVTSLANARPYGVAFPQPPRTLMEPLLGPAAAMVASYAITGSLALAGVLIRGDRLAFGILGLAMVMPAQEWHAHYYLIPVIAFLPLGASWAAGVSARLELRESATRATSLA
jgi:hypothetical protein